MYSLFGSPLCFNRRIENWWGNRSLGSILQLLSYILSKLTTEVGDNRLQRLPTDIAVFSLVADAEDEHFLLEVFARAKFPRALWNARGICGLQGLITAPPRFRAATCATPATLNNVCSLGVCRIKESLDD